MALDAGLDVELPATDCYGAAAPRRARVGPRRRDDARRGGAPRAAREVRPRPVRASRTSNAAAVARAAATAAHRELARDDRAQEHRAAEATTASLPLAAEVAVDRRDRAERRRRAQPASATTRTRRTSSRCSDVLDSGGSVLVDSRRRGGARSTAVEMRGAVRPRRAARRGSASRVRVRAGLRRDGGSSAAASREAVDAGRAADVAVMVMGDKSGLDRGLHERRVPRPRFARPPGRAGGARARGGRDRHARRARARRRAGRRRARGLHEHCAAVADGVAPRRGGAARDRRRAHAATSNPGGKLPISYPALGRARSRSSTGTRLSGGRSQPDGRLRRPARRARCTRSAHGLGYTTFELSDARVARARRCAGTDEIVVDVAAGEHGTRRPETRSCSCTFATRRRASRGPMLELKSFVRVELDAGELDDGSHSACRSHSSASTTAARSTSSSRALFEVFVGRSVRRPRSRPAR